MTTEAIADAERFKRERPLFERLASVTTAMIEAAMRQAGIACTVQARAKTVDSFVKKILVKPQRYEEVWDKAGVRVVVKYPDERSKAADVVTAAFDITWQQDYAVTADPRLFGYRGHHFTIRLRAADAVHHDSALRTLHAEVQVQTPGESMWASVCHDTLYKAVQDVPPEVHRCFARVSALLEGVDLDLVRARESVANQNGASTAMVLSLLEKHFLRFAAHRSDPALSAAVIAPLLSMVPSSPAALAHALDAFVTEQHDRLAHVYKKYQFDVRHPLLSQPESILIFYLIEQDEQELTQEWNHMDEELLEGLISVWA